MLIAKGADLTGLAKAVIERAIIDAAAGDLDAAAWLLTDAAKTFAKLAGLKYKLIGGLDPLECPKKPLEWSRLNLNINIDQIPTIKRLKGRYFERFSYITLMLYSAIVEPVLMPIANSNLHNQYRTANNG